MLKHDYGRIVNIASVAGKEGNPNASAYSASKAGVIGLTKSLGKELAKTGIRVNCVTPAAVRTAIFDQMTQQHIDFMLSKIPMGRFGSVDEIAALVCWLASEECSFSTGAVFDLSGDARRIERVRRTRATGYGLRTYGEHDLADVLRSIPSARARRPRRRAGTRGGSTGSTAPRARSGQTFGAQRSARSPPCARAGSRAASIR